MKLNAGDRPNESQVIALEIANFPAEFGLNAFPGKRFRISPSASYVTRDSIQLYTEIQDGNRWLSFAKATPEELSHQIAQ